MPRPVRSIERVEFEGEAPATVVHYMTLLDASRDGWINIVPKHADDEDEPPTTLSFSQLVSGGGSSLTMCTWVPCRDDRPGHDHHELGITHNSGQRAGARLAAASLAVPGNWFIAQDHPRRGLVVHIPRAVPHDTVLTWGLRATALLSHNAQGGRWLAEIHLPS